MQIDVLIEDDRWAQLSLEELAERAGAAVMDQLGAQEIYECALLACDDARIKTLNADFRDKDSATNVLSWPTAELIPPALPSEPELGDIALSYDTCAREAHEADKSLNDHVTHLIVHGILHLLGYDHMSDAEANAMEALEIKILGNLGIANPY